MATLRNGVHGSVSGKVGSVVYCTWKDIPYVRSRPHRKKSKKPTDLQKKNRTKFSFMQEHISRILPFVRIGFTSWDPKRTGHNSAMSYNLRAAILETDTGYTLDYAHFAFAQGHGSPIIETNISQLEHGYLIQWSYDEALAKQNDLTSYRSLILFYPEDVRAPAQGTLVGACLDEKRDLVSIPDQQKGICYHAYLAFFKVDGSNQTMDSIYMGAVNT